MNAFATDWVRTRLFPLAMMLLLAASPGCASMRSYAPRDLGPCQDGFAPTADGWNLGVRHYHPKNADPNKFPVVLCHGLGLNGTFWTITDNHLPKQLMERGYRVYVVDLRASGGSFRSGSLGKLNRLVRETPFPEIGNGDWTVDDLVRYDIPAILKYVEKDSGSPQVNWVGHSLGGMVMFPYLEMTREPWRIRNFVGMGSAAGLAHVPQTPMLRANRGLQVLLRGLSTGRMARPMSLGRPPGLDKVDRFYYSAPNVDSQTVARFYGYTLEDLGRGALRQLEPYLEEGRMLSADRKIDYVALLPSITTPTLLVAGDGDIMADLDSKKLTFNGLSSTDKELKRFGKAEGHVDDYGHCDLVWSRHAPREIFPVLIQWLDARQTTASPQSGAGSDAGVGKTPSPQTQAAPLTTPQTEIPPPRIVK